MTDPVRWWCCARVGQPKGEPQISDMVKVMVSDVHISAIRECV